MIYMLAETPVMITLAKQKDAPYATTIVVLKSKKIQTNQVTPTLLPIALLFQEVLL
jgi:hypothetical protein